MAQVGAMSLRGPSVPVRLGLFGATWELGSIELQGAAWPDRSLPSEVALIVKVDHKAFVGHLADLLDSVAAVLRDGNRAEGGTGG